MKLNSYLLIASLSIFFICNLQKVNAQRNYKAIVVKTSGNKIKGDVVEISSDSLILQIGSKRIILTSDSIRMVKMRRRGAIGRTMIVGAISGFIVFGAIGYAAYTPPACQPAFGLSVCIDSGPEGSALGGAVAGFFAGTIVGAIIGSSSKEFIQENNESTLKDIKYFIDQRSPHTRKRK